MKSAFAASEFTIRGTGSVYLKRPVVYGVGCCRLQSLKTDRTIKPTGQWRLRKTRKNMVHEIQQLRAVHMPRSGKNNSSQALQAADITRRQALYTFICCNVLWNRLSNHLVPSFISVFYAGFRQLLPVNHKGGCTVRNWLEKQENPRNSAASSSSQTWRDR